MLYFLPVAVFFLHAPVWHRYQLWLDFFFFSDTEELLTSHPDSYLPQARFE